MHAHFTDCQVKHNEFVNANLLDVSAYILSSELYNL